MSRCQEADVPAPRMGCSCRECYHARERSLDPRLISLVREQQISSAFSAAREIIYRCLQYYLSGRIEWAALYPEMIEALVKQSDDANGRLLKIAEMSPLPKFIPNT